MSQHAFVVYSIGVYEWLAGTRQALLLYWVTSVLGMLLAARLAVAPLYWGGTPLGHEVALMSDVGPSAGGLGYIGGWWTGCRIATVVGLSWQLWYT